ncbi:MAG TPA: NTP transferase domain-containing protein, partial [Dermatophilaceae bacterium]
VLAAGGGSRLGRPKAEVVVGGRRLVDLAIGSCARAGMNPVVVVLGAVWLTPMPLADSLDADIPDAPDADAPDAPEIWLVENGDWATGMASSLKAGLAALELDPGIDAVVVTLVDTISVGEQHLRRVGSALKAGATAAVATYDGRARTPVGLAREVWADVAATVAGDEGARGWLRAHSDLVTNVECADLGSWTDIDTSADLPD